MPAPVIRKLPTPPNRQNAPAVFAERADAFLGSFPNLAEDMNDSAAFVDERAGEAEESAQTAVSARNAAQQAATQASLNGAQQVQLAAQKVQEASSYAQDAADFAAQSEQSYQSALAVAGAFGDEAGLPALPGNARKALMVNPTGTGVEWGFPGQIMRSARTSNAVLTAADRGALIDLTGTFTQTFAAASALGNGWYCYIRNGGTGDITLDPSGSEQIDGLASYVMYPGEVRLVLCDGAAFRTVVLNSFYKVFTASGNFIKPPGYSAFEGLLWGAGGGGWNSSGGGGGGCSPILVAATSIAASTPVLVGAGGDGSYTSAGDGGTSSFSGVEASGGRTGYAQGFGGSPGSMPRTNQGSRNSDYGGGVGVSSSSSEPAGHSIYGGGGGGTSSTNFGRSVVGGNGGSGSLDAQAPGGGGGPRKSGARGEVRLWGVI